ncbi:hypothetical protein TWF730_004657 [Orbilia blumenaviensis]|uniref:Uncharacterized protein n=1 Tax=Orbilia blumenaviensis TaxID=1796055 RepID=A0AAV9U0U5_9PEZI
MKQSFHRYLLPPALLIVHALLLLPILIPYRPDNSPNPESSLQVALNSARYALPLACIAFATTCGLRLLARSQAFFPLEGRVSWVLLFSLGIAEEFVRWGVARCLSNLEGGGGGYGAKNPEPKRGRPIPGSNMFLDATSVEVEPGIWEGIYLMGWLWSALECMYTWWSLRPRQTLGNPASTNVEYPVPTSRPQSYHSWRKEHAKKRSTDSTIRTIRGLSRKPDIPFTNPYSASLEDRRYQPNNGGSLAYQGLLGKFEDRASSPELSRRIAREEDNDAGDEETSATDNDNDPLDSPLTPTAYLPVYHAPVPAQPPRPITDEEDDQEESTPTQQKHNSRFMPGSITSDSDYFGGREHAWAFSNQISPNRHTPEPNRRLSALISDSETEGLISGAQTPLLSSSIPLDQEQTSLLDHPNGPSYGSTQQLQTPLGTLPLNTNPNKFDVTNRPSITSHPSYLSITTGDEAEDESDTQGAGGSFNRAYPPRPTFSASYFHQHFPSPSPNLSNTTYGQLTPTNATLRLPRPKLANASQTLPIRRTKAKRPRSFPGIPFQHTPLVEPLILPPRNTYRPFNGVESNAVPAVLAIVWVIIIAFQHIGYGLWFVWFPTPIFEGVVQGWSIIFFVGIALSKGVYVAEIGSSWIKANGLLWVMTFGCLVISFVLYFIALVLWGVLW